MSSIRTPRYAASGRAAHRAYHLPVFRIAIIGAGPAGSVAAILLARAGHHVTLIEKSRFPRDKVCGECLSATGIEVLRRLGLGDAVESLGGVALTRSCLHAADGTSLQTSLPRAMLGLSRSAMDTALLDEARASGAEILQPAFATIRGTGLGQVQVDLRLPASVRSDSFDIVLLADGASALLDKKPALTGDFGIKAHFANVASERDAIHLFAHPSRAGYTGLAPIENQLFNVACSVPGSLLKQYRGDIESLWQSMLDRLPHLHARFAAARRVGPWLTCPLPRFGVRSVWPANVMPIGNAAAALEPVGGEGMGLAMRSAELATAEIIRASREKRPIDSASLAQSFHKLWRTRRAACRATALLLTSDRLAPAALGVANEAPWLARVGLKLIGK